MIKYPRTPHLPWSPGAKQDDVVMTNLWGDVPCVITEKIDGENTTMYNDYIHARSLDSRHHPSRSWVKNLHSSIRHLIPDGYRICGENVYAKHSIYYTELPSYFLVFSIWNDDICLSWDDTKKLCQDWNLHHVPEICDLIFDANKIKKMKHKTSAYKIYTDETKEKEDIPEGYVVRKLDSFCYNEFDKSVCKYVRKSHIQTDEHWMSQKVVPNLLESSG